MNETRAQWSIAAGTGVAVLVGAILLFGVPSAPRPPERSPRGAGPLVQIRDTSADRILRSEAEIRDLRPLFLPTEFNVTLPEPRREPGKSLLDNETLKWTFAETELNLAREFPPVATLNDMMVEQASIVDVIEADGTAAGLRGFGRRATPPAVPRPSGGSLRVIATGSGAPMLAESLPAEARPGGDSTWAPLEMLAIVDAAGLAAPLAIMASSRFEEVDSHYRNYLARTYRLGERLPPGVYRVVVGP